MGEQVVSSTVQVSAEKVGGIDETHVEFTPGVTVLAGRNATNRTSLLLSIMAALGSETTSLKADAESGRVELTLDGETYTRTLERQGGQVVADGDPYLDDPELADLFAFLVGDNETRRAVQRNDDLRDIIMRPVDTETIQRRIEDTLDRKRRVEEELDELDSLADEHTQLVGKRTRIEDDIDDLRERRDEKEAEIADADADLEETREEKAELEEKLSELQEVRSTLDDVRYSIDTQRESLESLRADAEDVTAELDDIAEAPAGELEETNRRIERLRGRKEALDANVNELQSVIEFNEETLEDGSELLDSDDDSDDGSVTDQLRDDDRTVACWTCGSTVDTSQIEETLDRLRSLREEKFEERTELATELDELESQRQEYERQRRRHEELKRERERIEDEIERREQRLDSLTEEREELNARIEELETEVERLRDESYGEILDLHKEANQLEFELERRTDDLDELESRIETVEDRLAERDELESRHEELNDELESLRTKVDRIEREAIEAFNTHMANVLDILEYGNVERIWLERTQREVREGRRTVTKSFFDLHVVRETASGATYEDTIDHLSESEREVTGLVCALAGYLVHEVYEDVPFVLLDSLEAIDSERISLLVEYLAEYADNLVVALLPEDAAALSESYPRITDI
ncbi:MAG: archaea-specific SMC-related protein [Haloplanus sp.]